MTEPADAPEAADNSPPPEGDAGDVLDSFKTGTDGADNENVHDAIGGRPRLSWNPVTDGGGRAPTESAEERSSFHFDLGGALARLGEHQDIAPAESRQATPPPPPPPAPPAVEPPPPPPSVEHALPQRAAGAARPAEAPAAEAPAVEAPAVEAPAVDHALPQRAPATPETTSAPLEPLPRRGERPAAEAPAAAG
ncbi:MAG TPA: hypothetical protein VFD53_08500, partial [Ilumatobacter sp.]|nr:hypothetical protein [Ilumatobacter sp.]